MSPSEQGILRLWELYDEAEGFITEISTMWDGVDIPTVNQLRYAGRHLLNSLTGKTSIPPEKEYDRAVAHAKRATFDALDSGIIYCLQKLNSSNTTTGTSKSRHPDTRTLSLRPERPNTCWTRPVMIPIIARSTIRKQENISSS